MSPLLEYLVTSMNLIRWLEHTLLWRAYVVMGVVVQLGILLAMCVPIKLKLA